MCYIGWGGSCRDGVSHVGVGGSCRGGWVNLGVGCSFEKCSRGKVGWCHVGVEWVM